MGTETKTAGSLATSGGGDADTADKGDSKTDAKGDVRTSGNDADKSKAAGGELTPEQNAQAEKDAAAKIEKAVAALEVKLPQGFDAKDAGLAELKKAAAEYGLDSTKTQRLFDLHAKQLDAHAKSYDQAGRDWLAKSRKEWLDSLKTDKDFGGANYAKSVKAMERVVAKYGDPELKKFADEGAGDHPAFVKFLARIGADMAEDPGLKAGQRAKTNGAADADAEFRKMFDKSPELFT